MNFESWSGGQFASARGGQFGSAKGGHIKSAVGGQVDRRLHACPQYKYANSAKPANTIKYYTKCTKYTSKITQQQLERKLKALRYHKHLTRLTKNNTIIHCVRFYKNIPINETNKIKVFHCSDSGNAFQQALLAH